MTIYNNVQDEDEELGDDEDEGDRENKSYENYPKNSAAMEIYHRIWLYHFSKGGATETFFLAASIYNCL